jgi:hypothetical protein
MCPVTPLLTLDIGDKFTLAPGATKVCIGYHAQEASTNMDYYGGNVVFTAEDGTVIFESAPE